MDELETALKGKKGAGAKGCNLAVSAEGDGLTNAEGALRIGICAHPQSLPW